MSIQLPAGYHWDDRLKLGRETAFLTALVWPAYLASDSDIPDPGLKFEISREEFARRFPAWGIRRDDTNELVAYANAAQLYVDLSDDFLPDTGFTFAIQSAASKAQPNCLCLLVANVDPKARGLGFSQALINRAKLACLELGFETMIAPVRPTLKHSLPLTSMGDYIFKRTSNGEIYDPWIKMHVNSGAQMVNVCADSIRVQATLGKWREWTGLPLEKSGEQLLPGGLVPLRVDVHNNLATYSEPNVWVRYELRENV
jgi:GNAT superfamily N-acetyltransferase